MSTIAPIPDPERNPRVKAVFDDIRATRKTDFINNLWQRLPVMTVPENFRDRQVRSATHENSPPR